jgi:hypothetical protein
MKLKRYLFIATAGVLFFLFSCKKNYSGPCCTANNPNGAIFEKWNIVSDSTFTGVGLNNHVVDYVGKAGDYFDITTQGVIYTKEGPVLDTLTYKLVSDSGIVIESFGITLNGVPETSHFKLDAHNMTIASPEIATPGGLFGRKITLSR